MRNEELYHIDSMGEMLTQFPEMTKKEIIAQAEQNALQMMDDGHLDEFETIASVERLKAYVESYSKIIRKMIDQVPEKEYKKSNVVFSMRNTGDRLDYMQDDIYEKLSNQLKERADLLKVAYKSTDAIYDADGVQVPKVGIKTHGGEVLTIKF